MSLKSASTDIFYQLADVVGQLTNAEYARPVNVLSGNTIGKHVRHILEFYELLVSSTETGELNYDRRNRDLRLEVDTRQAIERIDAIDRAVQALDLSRPLLLLAEVSADTTELVEIPSSFSRELHYNIEHAIHHLALVQVAVRAAFPMVELPENFGVAASTVKHKRK
jgi:uncharacterized damage-inducible protein DinB